MRKLRKGCAGCGVVLLILIGVGVWLYGGTLRDLARQGILQDLFRAPDQRAWVATSEQNLKALHVALMLYHDSEGQFPEGSGWMDAIENRLRTGDLSREEAEKKLIRPDLAGQPGKFGYALNAASAAKFKDDVGDGKTPLLFESTPTERNASGDPAKIRKAGGLAIAVDGSILR